MSLEKSIILEGKKFAKENKELIKLISSFDRIAIFRHIMPDYDALGTQLGLKTWILDNFPEKEVKVLGDNHVTFTPRLFPEMDKLSDSWFNKPFLAIIVDVANLPRIADPRYQKAEKIFVMDHHPKTDEFATIQVTDTSTAAAGELVASLLLNHKKYVMSREAATYFYTAIVGDSGRFQYSSTTAHTFAVASELIKRNINISDIYQNMYVKKLEDLDVTAYILQNYHVSSKGVAYYVLEQETLDKLKITVERGKENVNLFSNIEGVNIWCSITEDNDPKDHCFRVSIRSRQLVINEVASQFGGGGHAQASGAKLKTLDDLPKLIKALDDLIK